MARNVNNIMDFYREYFKPRFFYVERYLDDLNFSKNISKKDSDEIKRLKRNAKKELKAVKKYHFISIVLYVAIYFSIVSFFLSDFYILGDLVSKIRQIIALVGTPVFIGAQFIVTRFRNIRFDKLSLVASHLISYSIKK